MFKKKVCGVEVNLYETDDVIINHLCIGRDCEHYKEYTEAHEVWGGSYSRTVGECEAEYDECPVAEKMNEELIREVEVDYEC